LKNQPTNEKNSFSNHKKGKGGGLKKTYPPCKHCGQKGHSALKCWGRTDAKCSKCNQLGHEGTICKNKNQEEEANAQVTDQEEEDQLFVATCFSSKESSERWLVDSGYTNHITRDKELFKELRTTEFKRVRVGNDKHLEVK